LIDEHGKKKKMDIPPIFLLFKFWEPVWYYEATAMYPAPNLLPDQFVGIAWDHGDAFTYEVWLDNTQN
jgi:hypothetical protein